MEKEKQIQDINNWAIQYPHRVFDDNFYLLRKYLTEETWKAVIQANPDMLDSASDKWRKIPDANIVNKYQGQAFSGEVRKAINEDGTKVALGALAVPGAIIGTSLLAEAAPTAFNFLAKAGEKVYPFTQKYIAPVVNKLDPFSKEFASMGLAGKSVVGGLESLGVLHAINTTADFIKDPKVYKIPDVVMADMVGLPYGLAVGQRMYGAYNKATTPFRIARLLNKNIDNTILPTEKTVRLYRGTGTNGPISTDGGTEQAGQWFTPVKTKPGSYLSELLAYSKRKGIDNPTYLEYVDIPESLLEYYRAKRILDPEKVEFEQNEDYLIPLDIKRNRIEIPHYTNQQERLNLYLGKSLPETPSNPNNTLWDTSKHIYYDGNPTKTSGLFLDFIDHSDEFISAKALNNLTKDNNYYFRQETYLDPIENIDILLNNKTNKQLLFKDGSMFNYQFPNDKLVLYKIPKLNITLKEIPQKPGIYYYDLESINMNEVKGDILEWDDSAKMYKITLYRKQGGTINYLNLFK